MVLPLFPRSVVFLALVTRSSAATDDFRSYVHSMEHIVDAVGAGSSCEHTRMSEGGVPPPRRTWTLLESLGTCIWVVRAELASDPFEDVVEADDRWRDCGEALLSTGHRIKRYSSAVRGSVFDILQRSMAFIHRSVARPSAPLRRMMSSGLLNLAAWATDCAHRLSPPERGQTRRSQPHPRESQRRSSTKARRRAGAKEPRGKEQTVPRQPEEMAHSTRTAKPHAHDTAHARGNPASQEGKPIKAGPPRAGDEDLTRGAGRREEAQKKPPTNTPPSPAKTGGLDSGGPSAQRTPHFQRAEEEGSRGPEREMAEAEAMRILGVRPSPATGEPDPSKVRRGAMRKR